MCLVMFSKLNCVGWSSIDREVHHDTELDLEINIFHVGMMAVQD